METTKRLTGFPLPRSRLPIANCGDGLPKPLVERPLGSEESRHEEIEETPELENVVLDRCSREDETMVRSKELDGFGKFRLPVLDDVTFVEDAVVPVDGSKEIDVVPDHLVRSDDDVEGGKGGLEETSLLEGSDVDDWTKVLGELEDLVVPVAGEGGRADDD